MFLERRLVPPYPYLAIIFVGLDLKALQKGAKKLKLLQYVCCFRYQGFQKSCNPATLSCHLPFFDPYSRIVLYIVGVNRVHHPNSWSISTAIFSPEKKSQEKVLIYTLTSITLPETNIAPENGWLEYKPFLLGFGLFSAAMLVLGGVHTQGFLHVPLKHHKQQVDETLHCYRL